mmetsp:Transcript_12628/g.30740  ORF Transcript_12628/g.30740 Transcript_12628/m.30740 type:complete len:396 (-) Transcript_12628:125-1312(-)
MSQLAVDMSGEAGDARPANPPPVNLLFGGNPYEPPDLFSAEEFSDSVSEGGFEGGRAHHQQGGRSDAALFVSPLSSPSPQTAFANAFTPPARVAILAGASSASSSSSGPPATTGTSPEPPPPAQAQAQAQHDYSRLVKRCVKYEWFYVICRFLTVRDRIRLCRTSKRFYRVTRTKLGGLSNEELSNARTMHFYLRNGLFSYAERVKRIVARIQQTRLIRMFREVRNAIQDRARRAERIAERLGELRRRRFLRELFERLKPFPRNVLEGILQSWRGQSLEGEHAVHLPGGGGGEHRARAGSSGVYLHPPHEHRSGSSGVGAVLERAVREGAEDDEDGDMDESPGGAIASPLLSPVSALSASPVPSPGGASSAGLPPEELHDADAEAVTRSLDALHL